MSRKTGRPLGYVRDDVLDAAMHVFWRHGYEAASLNELTRAMGITSPSLYAAFGDKRSLFREALDRYLTRARRAEDIIDAASCARTAAQDLMEGAAVTYTGIDTPPGCMLASSAIAYSDAASEVGEELADIRRAIEAHLLARFQSAVSTGELPANTDVEALAGTVVATIHGISTLARDGASREKLFRIIATVMRAWPPSKSSPR